MGWLRSTIIDIVVTVCIVFAAFVEVEWARWVIWIYTPFILLLKIGVLFAPPAVKKGPSGKKKKEEAPEWFFHVLYAANVVLLVVAGWWLVAAGWAAIWVISYVAYRRK